MKKEEKDGNAPNRFKISRRQILITGGILLLLILVLVSYGVHYGRERIKRIQLIQQAINNPEKIDPEKLLGQIDHEFRGMSRQEKAKILEDPKAVEKYVEKATYQELIQSFDLLFKLPKPIRKKIIQNSVANLKKRAEVVGDDKIDQFIDSSMGKGALRGASRFFFLNLSGKQKAEVVELTDTVSEIIHRRARNKSNNGGR